MLFSLEGLRGFITGGAGGMGIRTAIAFAKQGADVIIADVREDGIKSSLDIIKKETGKTVDYIVCDLSNIEKTKTLFDEAESKFGPIDILVNNAGAIDPNHGTLLENHTEEQLDRIMNVNFKAPFFLSKSAVKSMSRRGFGRIINISSIAAFKGEPGHANYSASKGALLTLTKTIAIEYVKKGITANCIAPGAIESRMTAALTDAIKKELEDAIPMGCMGNGDDIAAAVTYLASKEARYVTGQTIHVNGGWLIA
ncbi:MAG: SDR family oxidoreductase [Alphaproteobacteria bacterium]|nr:SDR family oxidoreductase [Alphaproteobacteria bacterium]